jgi:hypothetical protein
VDSLDHRASFPRLIAAQAIAVSGVGDGKLHLLETMA